MSDPNRKSASAVLLHNSEKSWESGDISLTTLADKQGDGLVYPQPAFIEVEFEFAAVGLPLLIGDVHRYGCNHRREQCRRTRQSRRACSLVSAFPLVVRQSLITG